MNASLVLLSRLSLHQKPVRLIDAQGERQIPNSEAQRLARLRNYKFTPGSGRIKWMVEIIKPAPAWQACYATTGAAIRHFDHQPYGSR